jgi:hypothetical protein
MQSEILRNYQNRVSDAVCRTSIMESDLDLYCCFLVFEAFDLLSRAALKPPPIIKITKYKQPLSSHHLEDAWIEAPKTNGGRPS